ncbi:MAG: tripartite tricarboxylate transporter substrate binding protein [Pseudomonadota bacterium]
MKNIIARAVFLAFSAAVCGAVSDDAGAQNAKAAKGAAYPDKPVRLLIASAAGGGTDIIARMLGNKLTAIWGQQVVADNRPGGGGVISTDILTKAAPDGHTLLLQSVGISYGSALYKNLPFDVKRDVAAVTLVASQPFVLAVHPSVPAKSVAELIRYARSRPGEVRFGSGGVSGASHLGSELFRTVAGLDMVHVPYKGTGPGMTALLGGEIHMLIVGVATVLPHAKSGKVRALGVTGAKRAPAMPDLPTVAEGGLPGYEFDVWYGLFAPAKTPRAILARINADANRVLQDPETRQRFAGAGVEAAGGSMDEFTKYLHAEINKWAKVIREAGIRAD